MLIDLSPQECVYLLESLARDLERQQANDKSAARDMSSVFLREVALKVRSQIVEDLSEKDRKATRSQINKYIDSQLQKIQELRKNSEENDDGGKQLKLF